MLSVYVAGVAILAWRRFDLVGVWRSIFIMSITIVLYLNVLAAVAQVFNHVSLINALILAQFKSPVFALHVIVILLFVVLGITAARRCNSRTLHLQSWPEGQPLI